MSDTIYKVVWLTGLPCSGKTTIAKEVARVANCEMIDGDDLRGQDFAKAIGFSPDERKSHLLSVGYWAKRLSKYNNIVCSFVSPYESARSKLPVDIMVHVKCSPETCAERDVKGMWAKAKSGEMKGFTGYDAPYEEPKEPDLILETEKLSLEECVKQVLFIMEVD